MMNVIPIYSDLCVLEVFYMKMRNKNSPFLAFSQRQVGNVTRLMVDEDYAVFALIHCDVYLKKIGML